uniref:RRM domain-containing protein n=1 Tax=Zea mays TaxID=4577 RepID=A0A804LQX8_MAIZE
MASPRGGFDEQDRRTEKGTEVFVGGLPRSATESTLREIFSSCGEIIDARIMKDQSGHSKGYGFVRFAKRDYANTAKRQKNGIEVQGKRLVVELSMDQDTVFFGNLCKEWTLEEFEELIHKAFKDVVSVDLAMASNLGSSNKKNINRGFGFVRFSSHAAAARVIRIGSRTDFMLGDILHPAINWADKESHLDPDEMAKMKSAFIGNLPEDVNEEYLRKLFGQFGEVVRVAISRKGQCPVAFVHFAKRSELENAIEEMDGKTVRGPGRGPSFKIQVSVARPTADNDKKRSREEVRTRRSNASGDRRDYSHGRYGHDSLDRQVKAPRLSNYVADAADPYESAVNSLPSAVKEVLLRILRLRIGTRYDIDIHCVKSLDELPESSALAVLNQFLISGGDKHNKGDYFASLVAKAETFGLTHALHGTTYLSRNPEMHSKRYPHEDYDFVTPRSSRYDSSAHHPSTYYEDDPPVSESRVRRYAEERSTIVRSPEPRPRYDETDIRINPEPRLPYESRHNAEKHLDRRYIQEHSSNIERPAEEALLSRERRFLPAAGYMPNPGGSDFRSRSPAEYSAQRQQMRFDPFTGEPYKFDPFTGEPIRPDPNQRRSGSLY